LQESTHLSDTPRTSSAKPLNSDFNTLSLLGNIFKSQTFSPSPVTPARATAQILQKLQISPVTVVSDFLKSVLETTKADIENCYGADSIRDYGMECVLTVPAIWSDSAKAQMAKAAEDAGFGSHQEDFRFISEPECVAVYALNAIAPNNLKARLPHHLGHVNRD
jgi:molecular chaperone DnaK (HSP70)